MSKTSDLSIALDEYIGYLKRLQIKAFNKTLEQLNMLKLVREVGIGYGLTDDDMDNIDWSEYDK